MVLEVQKSHKWDTGTEQTPVIGLGCIGGSLEGDETVIEGLKRECMEEIGCGITLRSADRTIDISPAGMRVHSKIDFNDLRPVMIWEDTGPDLIPGEKVIVFYGQTFGDPHPIDLPAILLIPLTLISKISTGICRVEDALNEGAKLNSRIDIPLEALLRPVGTLKFLYALQQNRRDLYDRLMRSI